MPADRLPREPARVASPPGGGKLICPHCDKVFNRTADVNRHMRTHDPNAKKRKCTTPGCSYETFQASNLRTHMNTHNGVKPHKCLDDPANCDFATADPASLTRHRQRRHNYKPPPRKPKGRDEKRMVDVITGQDKAPVQQPVREPVQEPAPEPFRELFPPPTSQNAVAGPSNHPAALEHPPIATLQPAYFSSSEDSDSDSESDSDSDSVNTDQFYPSSVSSHGYDNFASFITVTALPQTPPLSQFSASPAHWGSRVKLEDDSLIDGFEQLDVTRSRKNSSDLFYGLADPSHSNLSTKAFIDSHRNQPLQ